jgi:hypothetical protein
MDFSASVSPRIPVLFNARDQLCKFSKMPQLFAPALYVRAAGGRQDIDARSVKQFLLHAVFTFALGELLVGEFSVKGHDVRGEFLELLRQYDAALGVVFALELLDPFRRRIR